jgi:hypothetical protein
LFATDWGHGVDPLLTIQSPNPRDIAVVPDPVFPTRSAVRVQIERGEDYSHVANGTPRGEMAFAKAVNFSSGHEYRVEWATLLPSAFVFDSDQMQIVMQIHQADKWSGSPPIMLMLQGADYMFSERGGSDPRHSRDVLLRDAAADRGKWIRWMLDYTPESTGSGATTELWKDGILVYSSRGFPNAYPDDQHAYLKLGVYKPSWQTFRSTVNETGLFYGPVSIAERRQEK